MEATENVLGFHRIHVIYASSCTLLLRFGTLFFLPTGSNSMRALVLLLHSVVVIAAADVTRATAHSFSENTNVVACIYVYICDVPRTKQTFSHFSLRLTFLSRMNSSFLHRPFLLSHAFPSHRRHLILTYLT